MEETSARRRLSPEARRREILDAAAELLAEEGYRSVSIQAIADRAGLAKAGVRHHFPAKADVLIALLEDRDAQLIELITASQSGRFLSNRAILDAVVERNSGQREIIRLFAVLEAESRVPAHPAHTYFINRLSNARAMFRLAAEGLPDPDQAALEIQAYLTGLELLWLKDPAIPYVALWGKFADRLFGHP